MGPIPIQGIKIMIIIINNGEKLWEKEQALSLTQEKLKLKQDQQRPQGLEDLSEINKSLVPVV